VETNLPAEPQQEHHHHNNKESSNHIFFISLIEPTIICLASNHKKSIHSYAHTHIHTHTNIHILMHAYKTLTAHRTNHHKRKRHKHTCLECPSLCASTFVACFLCTSRTVLEMHARRRESKSPIKQNTSTKEYSEPITHGPRRPPPPGSTAYTPQRKKSHNWREETIFSQQNTRSKKGRGLQSSKAHSHLTLGGARWRASC